MSTEPADPTRWYRLPIMWLVVALPLDSREIASMRSLGVPLVGVAEPLMGVHGERIDNVAAARLAGFGRDVGA